MTIHLDRQAEQYKRFLAWANAEGTLERPIVLDTYMKPHQQARIQWLREHAQGRTAEVGCNWGYVLASVGGVAGVDVNPGLVDLAQVFAPARDIRLGDAAALPWRTREFDTVMLTEVIEHLEWRDVLRAVDEALRCASVQVLITVPDGREDTEDACNLKHRWLMDDDRLEVLRRHITERTGRLPMVSSLAGFICIVARI